MAEVVPDQCQGYCQRHQSEPVIVDGGAQFGTVVCAQLLAEIALQVLQRIGMRLAGCQALHGLHELMFIAFAQRTEILAARRCHQLAKPAIGGLVVRHDAQLLAAVKLHQARG
jgi:hypothetical protein